jgi:hypothetical protein
MRVRGVHPSPGMVPGVRAGHKGRRLLCSEGSNLTSLGGRGLSGAAQILRAAQNLNLSGLVFRNILGHRSVGDGDIAATRFRTCVRHILVSNGLERKAPLE